MSNTENFNRGAHENLPEIRKGFTQKMIFDGVNAYLRTGQYTDGRLAEIFIDFKDDEQLGKEARAFINNFSRSISIGLQHGVPLEVYVDTYCSSDSSARTKKVEGVVGVTTAVNIIDSVFQVLRKEYCSEFTLDPSSCLVKASNSATVLKLSDYRL